MSTIHICCVFFLNIFLAVKDREAQNGSPCLTRRRATVCRYIIVGFVPAAFYCKFVVGFDKICVLSSCFMFFQIVSCFFKFFHVVSSCFKWGGTDLWLCTFWNHLKSEWCLDLASPVRRCPQRVWSACSKFWNQHLHFSRVVCSMCTSREVIRLVLQHVGAKICTMVFATFQNCNLHFPSICMAYSSVHLQVNV